MTPASDVAPLILYVGQVQELPAALIAQGMSLTMATGPEAAVTHLTEVGADLVVLDQTNEANLALCRLLKADPMLAGIPIILVLTPPQASPGAELLAMGLADWVARGSPLPEVVARVRAQLRLAELIRRENRQQQVISTMLAATDAAILVLEGDGRVIFASKAAQTYYPADLVGSSFATPAASGDDRFGATVVRRALAQRQEYTETVALGPEEYCLSAIPLRGPVGHRLDAWVLLIRHTSEEKWLNQQLRRSRKMESVSLLAGGIAHDLNNILGGMIGYISILRAKTSPGDESYPMLEMIDRASDRAAEVIARLLSFASTTPLEVRELDITPAAREALDHIRKSLHGGITVVTELAERLPPIVTDPSQFQQIATNLCLAAGEALPGSGQLVVRTFSLVPGDARSARYEPLPGPAVCLQIAAVKPSTGGGLLNVSELRPFSSNVAEGAGLGLAIVRDIVCDCGGRLLIEGSPDKEVLFSVIFPVRVKTPLRPPGNLVLVIEDEELLRRMVMDALALLGYRSLGAATGELGRQLFLQHLERIHLAIVDVVLPDISGAQLAAELRQANPACKFLLTSGGSYNRDDLLQRADADDFLAKPFKYEQLRKAVSRLIPPSSASPASGQ